MAAPEFHGGKEKSSRHGRFGSLLVISVYSFVFSCFTTTTTTTTTTRNKAGQGAALTAR